MRINFNLGFLFENRMLKQEEKKISSAVFCL